MLYETLYEEFFLSNRYSLAGVTEEELVALAEITGFTVSDEFEVVEYDNNVIYSSDASICGILGRTDTHRH